MMKQKESSLGDLLLLFRRNIVESIRKEGFHYDLTFSEVEVLHFIGPGGKETMKNIAEYLKITPPSATEIVKEMEKNGLVKRHSDRADRRLIYVLLTNTSKKLFASLSKRKDAVFKKMTSKLNEKDKKNLERIIRILVTE